jgi:predicted PurR-regulated permease PerM
MNKKSLDLKSLNSLKPLVAKFVKKYSTHAAFGAVIVVLLVYILVVFKISSLAKAEPGPDQTVPAANLIPKVNQKSVSQIQSLEQSNTQIHSLFESARNNPFQE